MKIKASLALCGTALLMLLSSCGSKGGFDSEITHVPFKSTENGRWGMVGADGKILFEEEFNNDNVPTVVTKNRFFCKNGRGLYEMFKADPRATQIGDEYVDIIQFGKEDVTLVVKKNEHISIIDTDGNVKAVLETAGGSLITYAYGFSDGLAVVSTENGYGCVNTKGEVVIEPNYCVLTSFSDGLAFAIDNKYKDESRGDRVVSLLDTKGNVVLTFRGDKFDDIGQGFKNGYAYVNVKDGGETKGGLVNKKMEFVVKPSAKTRYISQWTGSTFIFSNESGEWGLKKIADGETLIRAKYSELRYATEDGNLLWARVSDGGNRSYILITQNGDEVGKDSYREVLPFLDGDKALVRISDREWGFINKKGEDVKTGGDFASVSLRDATGGIESDYVDFASILATAEISSTQLGAYGIRMKSEQIANAWYEADGRRGSRPTPSNYHKDRLTYSKYEKGVNYEWSFYYNAYLTSFSYDTYREEWTKESPAYVSLAISGRKLYGKSDMLFEKIASVIKTYGEVTLESERSLTVKIGDSTKMELNQTEEGASLRLIRL